MNKPLEYIDNTVKSITESLEEKVLPTIIDKDNLLKVIAYVSPLTGFASANSDIVVLVLLREAEKLFAVLNIIKTAKWNTLLNQ